MTEPTDAELDELRQANSGRLNFVTLSEFRTIARAVLARWGQPAHSGEPVAWLDPWTGAKVTTDYDAYGKHGIPLYTTQQPTQPQAGAVPQGWKAVPVNPTPEMWKAAKTVPDPNPPYPPHYGLVWDAMLAATPTPPAEQQAATSQPTQAADSALDDAVPLDEARRLFDAGWKAAALFCDREDVVADGIIGFGACPQFEAAFSAANGIKGGQHGAE